MKSAFTADQAAAFRLQRQHLSRETGSTLIDVCRDSGGIQAQMMPAAEMSLWTRRQETTREEIRTALWTRRDLVKTSAMRMTLHLIPASDLATYIAALKPNAWAILQRICTRLRAKPADLQSLMSTVVDALADGPKTHHELVRLASRNASRGVRVWLKLAWSAVRPAVAEGLILYGPSKGGEATFVRTDTWLPRQPTVTIESARATLLRRSLSAFGPATPHDFSKWSGIRIDDAKTIMQSIADEAVQVTVDGASGWLLRDDVAALAESRLDDTEVRLLPAFDTLLLAHATKEHLVARQYYKRVYRPQAWISPVVLVGGRVVAVWFSKTRGARVDVDVQPFERIARSVRNAIGSEIDALAAFVGARCDVTFTEPRKQ
jgi:Winged helix DNA-binding domain